MPNESEFRRWNDEQTVATWPKRERFTDRVLPHVVAALQPRPGERVVDIGSGGGKLTLEVARAVAPGGSVVGADISAGMAALAAGRATEAGAANVRFVVGDMQEASLDGGPFDAAVSQFGVMFFSEPVAAFANIRRHLRPGGRITFACWQPASRNSWFPGPVLAPFAPPPAPLPPGKSPTGPFALADPRRTRRMLAEAGFTAITRTPKRVIAWTPEDSVADESQLVVSGVPRERAAEALAALRGHFARFPRRGDGLCRFELCFQVFRAVNP